MLNKLKAIFAGQQTPPEPAGNRLALAVAALLVEAARADEAYTEREKTLIDEALGAQFSLEPEEAKSLRCEGEVAQARANDLHKFTKAAKSLSAADKVALIERLWTIVLSDGDRDPHEDALIRRVCGLIYVSDRDSGAARLRVAAALAEEPGV
jgi:uncharacterized tellurite resistance protein B-like protein